MAGDRLGVDESALVGLRDQLRAFVSGETELSGLSVYYLLERATPLLGFHTMLRRGPQNRMRAGLQQSYGDHNRLLLLGLDKLCEGDLDWYRQRLERPGAVPDSALETCFATVRLLGIPRPTLLALWLGAALHDCGMLGGQNSGIDVEDGVVLADSVLSTLCPPELVPLATFAIRNHDYVKGVFLGEVPAGFIGEQLVELPEALQPTALAALGMIQVAGAASLGEGRLSAFRVSIFERCSTGIALEDTSACTRLARLLAGGAETTTPPSSDDADEVLARLPVDQRPGVARLLERVPVHGWHRTWNAHQSRPAARKATALTGLAALADHTGVEHLVLVPSLDLSTAEDGTWNPPVREVPLANATTALVVG